MWPHKSTKGFSENCLSLIFHFFQFHERCLTTDIVTNLNQAENTASRVRVHTWLCSRTCGLNLVSFGVYRVKTIFDSVLSLETIFQDI